MFILKQLPRPGLPSLFCRCLLLCTALVGAPVQAQVYSWSDAAGQVHYSDQPPPTAYKDYAVPSSNAVEFGLDDSGNYFSEQAQLRAEQTKKKAEQAKQRKQQAQQCDQAQARAKFLQERIPNRILITGSDGQPTRMTVEQWNAERAKAQAGIAANC